MEKQQVEKFLAGHYEKGASYKYFLPHKIDYQWQWTDGGLNTLNRS